MIRMDTVALAFQEEEEETETETEEEEALEASRTIHRREARVSILLVPPCLPLPTLPPLIHLPMLLLDSRIGILKLHATLRPLSSTKTKQETLDAVGPDSLHFVDLYIPCCTIAHLDSNA